MFDKILSKSSRCFSTVLFANNKSSMSEIPFSTLYRSELLMNVDDAGLLVSPCNATLGANVPNSVTKQTSFPYFSSALIWKKKFEKSNTLNIFILATFCISFLGSGRTVTFFSTLKFISKQLTTGL